MLDKRVLLRCWTVLLTSEILESLQLLLKPVGMRVPGWLWELWVQAWHPGGPGPLWPVGPRHRGTCPSEQAWTCDWFYLQQVDSSLSVDGQSWIIPDYQLR